MFVGLPALQWSTDNTVQQGETHLIDLNHHLPYSLSEESYTPLFWQGSHF